MTTAKVAYTYHENPYIVMPIEIPNDPNLAFTRAANKVALYGPTWLLLTSIPHIAGMGNIWQTIIAFKSVAAIFYLIMCFLIWKTTKNMRNVLFFALNPLVIIEILISGHNDIVMIVLACSALLLWYKSGFLNRIMGIIVLILSILVKGATIVLIPLFFLKKISLEKKMFFASICMLIVFLTVAPLREELYPWYGVWFLAFASFLPFKEYSLFMQFCIVFSFSLELRHIPYMAMGYYEGPGPMMRIVLTSVPVVLWIGWYIWKNGLPKNILKKIRM
jgi:hypothetical protein